MTVFTLDSHASASELFEELGYQLGRARALERRSREMQESRSASATNWGAIANGGGRGNASSFWLDSAIDMEEEAKRIRREAGPYIELAHELLYGENGLSRLRGETDAAIVERHYLHGEGWAEMASELAKPGAKSPRDWCRRRACRALQLMDRNDLIAFARERVEEAER